MSEEFLWYLARVSGLMTWILSFGALTAGLVARSEPNAGSIAGQWASDSRNFLGRASVVALAVHAGTIAAAERFPLPTEAVLIGREGGRWLAAAFVLGVLCGWAVVVVEFGRLVVRRFGRAADGAALLLSGLAVTGGAVHGWRLGSDTGNPLALTIIGLCGLVLVGAAALGLTPLVGEPAVPEDRARGAVDSPTTVPLGMPIDGRSRTGRGPAISSARDVSIPDEAVRDHPHDPRGQRWDRENSWSVRRLPDAPEPRHRPSE